MKLCPHCSASLEDDTVQCSACGKWVISKPPGRTGGKKSPQKRSGRGVRLLILTALVAAAWALWANPGGRVDPAKLMDPFRGSDVQMEALRADLERLSGLEEEYFRLHGEYSGSPGALGFAPDEGVTVSIIATPTGWSGAATHEELGPDQGCAVYQGSVGAPAVPVRPPKPGSIVCTGEQGGQP